MEINIDSLFQNQEFLAYILSKAYDRHETCHSLCDMLCTMHDKPVMWHVKGPDAVLLDDQDAEFPVFSFPASAVKTNGTMPAAFVCQASSVMALVRHIIETEPPG